MISEYEALDELCDRIEAFGFLYACTDEHDEARVAFRELVGEEMSRLRADLVFFDVELKALGAERIATLADDPNLAPWRHWLRRKASTAHLALSEPEERVVVKKNIAGRDAIVRFRQEFTSKLDFGSVDVDGASRKVTESDLRSLGEHPDAGVRQAAQDRLLEVYRRNEEVVAFLYRAVVKDTAVETELRKASHPIQLENLPNEIPDEVVRALVEATRAQLPLLHEYYAWKGAALGLPRMRTCDRLAQPAMHEPEPIGWPRGRELVSRALESFDQRIGTLSRDLLDARRVDAAVRQGKRGGGFCYPVPGRGTWILMNYTDTVDSMFTLAHEIGHAVHFLLGSESQRPLQAHASSKVIAETASEFAECILIDQLERESADDRLLAHVLAHACQGFTGVVYRQVMFTEFELAAHERAAREPLTNDFMRQVWDELSREYYGPNVDLAEQEAWGYCTIPHFVFNPFYCYSYALSQVVVMALYEQFRADPEKFVPGYVDLLSSGASASPQELLARLDIDLRDPSTLQRAFATFRSRFDRLREIVGTS